MSTKISALDERLQANINGEEFFPIIDGTVGAYQTYKINLDQLFQSGQGYEKVTSLSVVSSNNTSFALEYTQEDNTVQTISIDKYSIQDNDVAFSHIDPNGYITSTQTLANNLTDAKLATAKSVDEHIDYREALYDTQIKGYIGDDNSGVLADFATLANVATDFTNLLDGVKPELNTFKKIEEQFDTIDYSDKIGTSQVNTAHFRINDTDLNKRLNIKDSAITSNLISVNAITTNKIVNGAVQRTKIADRAVSNDKIDDATITNAKIKDDTITHTKLSVGRPEWNSTQVNIPTRLDVATTLLVRGNITSNGTEIKLYNAAKAGTNVHSGRALVHSTGDKLIVNHGNDYTGGVNIKGIVTVPDQDDVAINAGGNRSVVTKEYVDAADILLNPIAGNKIQDNAIALRHMSDNSVGTLEILDDSITSAKIENIGPQWNTTGDVVVSGKLTANGQTFTLGSNVKPNGNVTLSLLASVSGSAAITRKTGANGSLLINNAGGNIDLSPGSGTSTKLQVSSSKSTVSNPLHITGAGSSSIDGTNFNNPALLVGSSTSGIAIDSNEVIQKGGNLHLGVSAGASQNIQFKEGVNTIATIYGNSGNIQASGDFITDSGIVQANQLSLKGNTAKIHSQSGIAVDVNAVGHIVAPLQTKALITSNQKSLTTREYVTSEIAKVFPDDNYILKTGGNVGGDLSFANLHGKGITWSKNTDFASIKFYNTSDSDADCRLEFQTGDNRNEYFLFTHQPSGAEKIDLLKISNSEISYKGASLMTGIATNQVVSNMIKSGAVTSAKIANSAVTTTKIGNNAVTTTKIGNRQVTEAKLADVAAGFVLGRGHTATAGSPNLVAIDTNLANGTSHNVVASGQAAKAYTDSKVNGLAAKSHTHTQYATKTHVASEIAKIPGGITASEVDAKDLALIKKIYPVGSIYTSTQFIQPNQVFGFGTWQRFGAGKVLVGVNGNDSDFSSAKKTGGSKTHVLTIDEMPSHRHIGGAGDRGASVFAHGTTSGYAESSIDTRSSDTNTLGFTTYTGGGKAHENMPPYITVYMWTRTA